MRLDRNEFTAFVNAIFAAKYGNQKANAQDVINFMAFCDKNGDKLISKSELFEVLNKL
jgi:hypothetical protein